MAAHSPAQRSSGLLVRGPGKVPIHLLVNGQGRDLFVEPRRTLLDALRVDLGLTGAKKGCDMGNCGACTVLLDGLAAYACLVLAVECEGRAIETIEGLASDGPLHPIQQAFIDCDALQCGFCTPGQIMALQGLLAGHPSVSREDIERALSGNLCRCGAYPNIVRAALRVVGEAETERGREGEISPSPRLAVRED
ncbi:MAG: (2Fe-2S)-binding protein [Chloroflexi bacterium]|nr:(2Fe-2S)-binding protein [Chloroflexota bacterium]